MCIFGLPAKNRRCFHICRWDTTETLDILNFVELNRVETIRNAWHHLRSNLISGN